MGRAGGILRMLAALRPSRPRIIAAICTVAVLHLAFSLPADRRRIGDAVQLAIPALGAACATARHGAGEYVGRFVANMAVTHGLKNTLGAREINRRPSGSDRGFPSGHTAAAVYGASYLVRECGAVLPYVGPIAAAAAGYVAGTRIESDKHTLPQVMAGAIVALVSDLALRERDNRRAVRRAWLLARRRLRRWWQRAMQRRIPSTGTPP